MSPSTTPSSPVIAPDASPSSRRPSSDSLRPPAMPFAPQPELANSPSVGSLASSYNTCSASHSQRNLHHSDSVPHTLGSKSSQTPLTNWTTSSDAYNQHGQWLGAERVGRPADDENVDEEQYGRMTGQQTGPSVKPANRFGGGGGRDWRFWMVFLSILLSTFIAALDMVRSFFLPVPPF